MKEANIFEAWVERLAEGTWSLPDTPEKQDQLIELLSTDLPVGADATNATEQLYDLVGDDELFDQLGELAERDANADARQVIMDRLQELSDFPEVRAVLDQLQIDDTAEMNPPEATNPADLEPSDDEENIDIDINKHGIDPEGDYENIAEDALRSIRRAAGLTENVLTDSTGSTLQHILDTFKRDVRDFKETGEVSDELHNALYDYYFDDMPYGTKKARDGDPYEWVADRFGADLGIDGYGSNSPGIPDSDYSMERESAGDYADEYQDSLSGILKIAGVPAQERPAPEYDHAEMDEAMFPGSAIGDKLRDFKRGQGQSGSAKMAMGMMPAAGAGAMAGSTMATTAVGATALFAPALGTGALLGAGAALGGFLTYKGLNWLAQKLFGTKEEALEFARAHLKAAASDAPQFTFQGKTYPVKIKSAEEARDLLWKIKSLQSQIDEANADSLTGLAGQAAGLVLPNPKDAVAGFKKTFETDQETDEGWKGTLAGSAVGGLAGDAAGAALGPAAGATLGGALGGPAGAIAGGLAGAAAGPAIGSAIGGLAGGKIGDELGGKEETKETIDPTNPRDYERPAVQRKGQEPLTAKDIEQKDRKAEFDYHQRAHGRPHPDSVADESKSPLAGQYGHAGKMKEVSKDVSFLDRLKELSGMRK